MTTKEFIEKAVGGGWGSKQSIKWYLDLPEYAKCQIWLDPLAWEAVGKVEVWEDRDTDPNYGRKMHAMIDALIAGETIKQYLETL